MRNNITVALSALKVFYSEAKDTIDLYGDVFLQAIGNESVSMGEAQKKIKKEFQIETPLSMLRAMAARLSKRKLIDWNPRNDNVRVTALGGQRQGQLDEKIKEVSRRENALLLKIKEIQLPNEEIEDIRKYMRFFIVNNPNVSVNLMLGDESEATPLDTKIEEALRTFFIKVESEYPEHYEYLKDMLFGQIVASNLLEKSEEASLKDLVFYIDTNIFLSLLDLNQDFDNKSAEDALNLIKANGAQIKMFAHLKDETIVLLKNNINTIDHYIHDIPVNTIGSRMKHKGYDKHHIQRLIENIDSKLNELGIDIAHSADEKIPFEHGYYKELIDEKDFKFQPRVSIENDCQSIEIIRLIRGDARDSCYYLHNSKAILLSSDRLMARFCRKKHSDSSLTVPEAFTPDQITGILWLNGVKSAPNSYINNFLSRNIASQLVDKGMWEKFRHRLMEEEKMGKLTQDVINQLMASENTKAFLLAGDEESIDQLFDESNIAKIKAEQAALARDVDAKKKENVSLRSEIKKKMDAAQESINQKNAQIALLEGELKKRKEEEISKQERREQAITEQAKKRADKQLLFFWKCPAYVLVFGSVLALCVLSFFYHAILGVSSILTVALTSWAAFKSSRFSDYLKRKWSEKRDKLIEKEKAKIKAERGLDE